MGTIDLDRGLWHIPAVNSKPDRERVVPLTPPVVEFFQTLQVLAGNTLRVLAFQASTHGHLGRKSLRQGLNRLFKTKGLDGRLSRDIEPVTVHDFRCAGRTGFKNLRMIDPISQQRVRIPCDVMERCLNHAFVGMAAIYDTGDLLDERRAALTAWSEHLFAIMQEGIVTPIRRSVGAA
jgi:integrase